MTENDFDILTPIGVSIDTYRNPMFRFFSLVETCMDLMSATVIVFCLSGSVTCRRIQRSACLT